VVVPVTVRDYTAVGSTRAGHTEMGRSPYQTRCGFFAAAV
jgi:hypothetical protein